MIDHRERFLAKANQDGSYSITVTARQLLEAAWVDFYDDATGRGYQRKETLRERRGREIEEYFVRCSAKGVTPRLFEMTASARARSSDTEVTSVFEPLDENGRLGFLTVTCADGRWMSVIDGGTRLLGIERAVTGNVIDPEAGFDVRLYPSLKVAEEIAIFLLINEKQKRVRTDLGLRVVQRSLDDNELTDEEIKTLQTVVPDTEAWRYNASRIAASLNTDADSAWRGLIQMPGDSVTKPIKLQAFWTSLKPLLDDADMKVRLDRMASDRTLPGGDTAKFVVMVLKNFWGAVSEVNPDAHSEPSTNVLWGSIGVSACHQALAPVMATILATPKPDLSKQHLRDMLKESAVADYDYWFSRGGTRRADYPDDKGEATTMTGGAGYSRLATHLAREWRAALHAASGSQAVTI